MYVKTIGDFKKLIAKHKIRTIYIDLDNTLLNTYLYYKTHLEMFPDLDFEPVFNVSKLNDKQKEQLLELWKNSNCFANLRLCTLVNATSTPFTIITDRDADLGKGIFTLEHASKLFNRKPSDILYLDENSKRELLGQSPYKILFDDLEYTQIPKVKQIFVMNPWNRKYVNERDEDFIFAY